MNDNQYRINLYNSMVDAGIDPGDVDYFNEKLNTRGGRDRAHSLLRNAGVKVDDFDVFERNIMGWKDNEPVSSQEWDDKHEVQVTDEKKPEEQKNPEEPKKDQGNSLLSMNGYSPSAGIVFRYQPKESKEKEVRKAKFQDMESLNSHYEGLFDATDEGKAAKADIQTQVGNWQKYYQDQFEKSQDYADIVSKYNGSGDYEGLNKELDAKFQEKYNKTLQDHMSGQYQNYYEKMAKAYPEYSEEIKLMKKEQVQKAAPAQLDALEKKIGTTGQAASGVNPMFGTRGVARYDEDPVKGYAKRLVDQTRTILDHADKGDSWFKDMVESTFKNTANGKVDYSGGVRDLFANKKYEGILEKAANGEKLTADEENLIEAAALNMTVTSYLQESLSSGYKAGEVTAQSIPFMLEFIANPISGSGDAIAKGLLKYALGKWGKKVAMSSAVKVGSYVAGRTGAALGMTATSSLPRVGSDYYERQASNYDIADDMTVTKVPEAEAESRIVSLGKAIYSTTAENLSEMIMSPIKGGSNSTILKGINKELNKIGLVRALKGAKKAVTDTKLAKATQFGGVFEEYGEEVVNNIMNTVTGDTNWMTEPNRADYKTEAEYQEAMSRYKNSVLNLDNNIDTFVGLIPTSMFFGVVGGVSMGVQDYNYHRQISKLFESLGEDGRNMADMVFRYDNVRDKVNYVINHPEIDDQQKQEIISLIALEEKQRIAGEAMDDQERQESESRKRGYDAPIEEYHDMSNRLRDTRNTLLSLDRGDEIAAEIDSRMQSGQSTDDIVSGLNDDAALAAQEYINSANEVRGVQDNVDDQVTSSVQSLVAMMPVHSDDVTGNTVTIGESKDGKLYFVKEQSDKMTIAVDAQTGETVAVPTGSLSLQTRGYDEYIQSYEDRVRRTVNGMADRAFRHNPKTVEPYSGLSLRDASGSYVVQQELDGSFSLLPTQLNKEGFQEVVQGSQPIPVDSEKIMDMQDSMYDAQASGETKADTSSAQDENVQQSAPVTPAQQSVQNNTKTNATVSDRNGTKQDVLAPYRDKSGDIDYSKIDNAEHFSQAISSEVEDTQERDEIMDEYIALAEEERKKAEKISDPMSRRKAIRKAEAKAKMYQHAKDMLSGINTADQAITQEPSVNAADASAQMTSGTPVAETSGNRPAVDEASVNAGDVQLTQDQKKHNEIQEKGRAILGSTARGRAIMSMAGKLGLEVEFVDSFYDKNGKRVAANGAITGNKLQYNINSDNPEVFIFGHEITHRIKDLSPEAFEEFKQALQTAFPAEWDNHVNEVRSRYSGVATSADEIEEEAVCDMAGQMFMNRNVLQKFAKQAPQSLLQKLAQIFKDMAKFFEGTTYEERCNACEDILVNALNKAIENVGKEEGDESGTRSSLSSEKIADGIRSTMDPGKSRYSMTAIATGAGGRLIEDDGNGNVAFEMNGVKYTASHPVTASVLKKTDSVLAMMMEDAADISHLPKAKQNMIWNKYADIINAFLRKGSAENGGIETLKGSWEWMAESIYRAVATNGDAQYSYSLDITRVCKKNEAVIKAISALQKDLGYGISPAQVMDIYYMADKMGYQVPCPVCYVFSRYIRNGRYATIAINGMRKYGELLRDPATMTPAEQKTAVDMWVKLLNEQEALNDKYEDQIKKAKEDITMILGTIDEKTGKLQEMGALDKLGNRLSQLQRDGASQEDIDQVIEEIEKLDQKYKAAMNVVAQSSLTSWIKQFAIHEKKIGDEKQWVLYTAEEQGDLYNEGGFDPMYALDLRLTADVMRKYPAIQRLRKSGGAAAGKEITFVADNALGEVPMSLNDGSPESAPNYYKMAMDADNEDERKKYRDEARKKFLRAHLYAQQQSLRGGQRMWSWSDNIERIAPDVAINLIQMEMLGGALQSYSKQLEGIKMVATMQGYVNGSLMGRGIGYVEVDDSNIEERDGKKYVKEPYTYFNKKKGKDIVMTESGSPVYTVDGKNYALAFDDVTGIQAYDEEKDGKTYKGLLTLNKELDKAGNILVGMNDIHIRAAMADPRVYFIIPWHSSGNSVHILTQMLGFLGVDLRNFNPKDYTAVQEEKDMHKNSNGEIIKIRPEITRFWEQHKNEKDFKCGIKGGVESGSGRLSPSQLHYRELRDAIFLGYNQEKGTLNKTGAKTTDIPAEWMEEILADVFLSQVYHTVRDRIDTGTMTNADCKYIYPYEYWDTESTYQTADVNGERYMEYCRRLGRKPKFVGKLDDNAKEDFGNFSGDTGYWKLLIDRRMYGVDDLYQDLDPVDSSDLTPELFDPAETEKEFLVTEVADDMGTEIVARNTRDLEEQRIGGVATVDYDMSLDDAVSEYESASGKMKDFYDMAKKIQAERKKAAKAIKSSKKKSEKGKTGKKSVKITVDDSNSLNKKSGAEYVSESDITRFSISRNNRKTMESWIGKWYDSQNGDESGKDGFVSGMMDKIDSLTDVPAEQLASARWFASGTVRLPEDFEKVRQAVDVARKHKVDPLTFGSPMEIINRWPESVKEKPINPDEVSTLHRSGEYKHGIVVYDVDDTNKSRENMRNIINTHFGKTCSPWCLLQGNVNGKLTEDSAYYWKHYNAYPKQVAFQNGKLLAFSANDNEDVVWWDKQDESHAGIPITYKDNEGRTVVATYNAENDSVEVESMYSGNKINGVYREYNSDGVLTEESNHKDGLRDGTYKIWYDNGQIMIDNNFKDGLEDGPCMSWYKNGQQRAYISYKDGARQGTYKLWNKDGQISIDANYNDGELYGPYKEWYDDGQIMEDSNYKYGDLDGTFKYWYYNGQMKYDANYKNGKLDGQYKGWYENGHIKVDCNYKDGHYEGQYKGWYENGNIWVDCNYKDGNFDGPYNVWYVNGKKRIESNYKDSLSDGPYKYWFENGQIEVDANCKDGEYDGAYKEWYDNGNIKKESNYKEGKLDGPYKIWYENGHIGVESYYKNGELVSDARYSMSKSGPKSFYEMAESVQNDRASDKARYSLVSREQDKAYMDAVNSGDMETAQNMVNEAARKAGYMLDDDYRMMHRAPNHEWDVNLLNTDGLVPSDYWSHPEWYTTGYEERYSHSVLANAKRRIDEKIKSGKKPEHVRIMVYRAVPKDVKEDNMRNGDWVTPSREYAVQHGKANINGKYRIIGISTSVKNLYWDANSPAELGYDNGSNYVYSNTKNNRKLADAVTYDDEGNVIPLSKRFNKRNSDVRYSIAKEGHDAGLTDKQIADEKNLRFSLANDDTRYSVAEIKEYAETVKTERPREEVYRNIISGLHALRQIAQGKDLVEDAMRRPDLEIHGSDGRVMFEYGKMGDPEKGFKKGYGISHIAARHGNDTLAKVLGVIATGRIERYNDGNKTIVLSDGDYEALLGLTKNGESSTWLFSGWDKIEKTGESGKVSASTTPTQGNPTFSRETLGAVISDSNLKKLFSNYNREERKSYSIAKEKADNRYSLIGINGMARVSEEKMRQYVDRAEQLEKEGADQDDIWYETGLERGADGKWRTEGPDLVLDKDAVKNAKEDTVYDIKDFVGSKEYDILTKLYPNIKDMTIGFSDMSGQGILGGYSDERNMVVLSTKERRGGRSVPVDPDYMNRILAHEVQHAIQYEEDFAVGGDWRDLDTKKTIEAGEKAREAMKNAGWDPFKRYKASKLKDEYRKVAKAEYNRLAGEVEARVVMDRFGTTEDYKRLVRPEEGLGSDVPRENQIVRFKDGTIYDMAERVQADRDEMAALEQDQTRYSIVSDKKTIEWFDKAPKIIVYKSMVKNPDGSYSAPMADELGSTSGNKKESRVKMDDLRKGQLYMADENPDLADENGHIIINKPQGTKGNGATQVAYNPYNHSSDTALNDQFTSAWRRPELVVVEVEITPEEWEKENPYHADKAKDPVGPNGKWKNGPVARKITDKTRTVYLTQYSRIKGDAKMSDVVKSIMDYIGKEPMPFNCVNDDTREALWEAGVKIVAPTPGMGAECDAAWQEWQKTHNPSGPKGGKPKSFYEMAERAQLKRGIRKEGKEIGLTDAQVNDMTRYALAWHGSGADFDRFDSDFIGSGEGAQAHGYGHYVALSKHTGKRYADSLGYNSHPVLVHKGVKVVDEILDRKYPQHIENLMNSILRKVSSGQDLGQAIGNTSYQLRQLVANAKPNSTIAKKAQESLDAIDGIDFTEYEISHTEDEHYLYEVDIPDNTGTNYIEEGERIGYDMRDTMLSILTNEGFSEIDHDDKSGIIRMENGDGSKVVLNPNQSGGDLYEEIASWLGNDYKRASEFLNNLGYAGIHYDGHSDGECYVIFDGDNIKINGKERYALAPEKKDRDEMFRNILSDGFTDLTLRQINDFIDKSHNGEERFKISPRVRDGYGQEGGRRDVNLDAGLILSRLAEGAASKTDRAVQEVAYRRIMQAYHSMLEEWAKATNNWYEYSGLGKLIKSYEYVSGTDSDVFESVNPGFVVKLSKGKPTKKNFRPDRDSTAIFNDVFKNTQYKVLGYGMDKNGNFVSILEQKAVNAESQATHDEIEEYMKSKGFTRRGSFGDTYESRDYIISDLKGGNVLKTKSGVVVIDADCLYNTPDRRGEHNIPKIETDFAGGKVPEFTRFSLVTPKQDAEYRKAYEDGDREKAMKMVKDAFMQAFPNTKVVDENGEPLVVYHNSIYKFNVFEEGHRSSRPDESIDELGRVGWFTSNPNMRLFGRVKYASFINLEKPFIISGNSNRVKEYYEAYNTSLEKMEDYPLDKRYRYNKEWIDIKKQVHDAREELEASKHEYEPFYFAMYEGRIIKEDNDIPGTYGEVLRNKLESEGYDGVIFDDTSADLDFGSTWVIPFNGGNVIKSADPFTFDDNGDLIPLSERFNDDSEDIRYSLSTPASATRDAWDKLASSSKLMYETSMFDYLAPLKKFQDLIQNKNGRKLLDYQDAYNSLMCLSSRNKAEMDIFENTLVDSLIKACKAVMGNGLKFDDISGRELDRYVKMKHGIERNRDMAVREILRQDEKNYQDDLERYYNDAESIRKKNGSWRDIQEELNRLAEAYGADLTKDYSGISGMTSNDDWMTDIFKLVEEFENEHERTDELWSAINAISQFSLNKQMSSGLSDAEYVKEQLRRYDYFVPLRGFDELTADEVYNYINGGPKDVGTPMQTAHGRTSEAGNAFGALMNVAYRSITAGNRNLAHQAFFNMVSNMDTEGTVVVNSRWAVKDAAGNFVETDPTIPVNASPEDIASAYEQFEKDMKALEAKGDAMQINSGNTTQKYRVLDRKFDKQHKIKVMVGGKEKIMTVVGNPMLSQAINGLLNPEGGDNGTGWRKSLMRFMSGAFTSYNPSFSAANLVRDTTHANSYVFVKEDLAYYKEFTRRQGLMIGNAVNAVRTGRLLWKYNNGKLDMNDETEKNFSDFMRYGGATGYTHVLNQKESVEQLGDMLKRLDNRSKANPITVYKKLVEFAGEAAELTNRFACYETSRKFGRSINRSVMDAKEVTLNFNRKGSGKKILEGTMGSGMPVSVKAAADMTQFGREYYMFFNANMQAKRQMLEMVSTKPRAAKTILSRIVGLGLAGGCIVPLINDVVLPMIYSMLDGGDGDDDDYRSYYDELTDYERQNNICIRLPKGKGWLKIPMNPDMTPFYAIGDVIGAHSSGARHIQVKDFIENSIDLVSPVSVTWNNYKSVGASLFPTAAQPFVQVWANTNFMGNSIAKEGMSRSANFDPEYKKTYKSVSPMLKELSRKVNELTGGDDVVKGWVDDNLGRMANPAVIQNILSGYLGGYGTTAVAIADGIYTKLIGESKYMPASNVPILGRFWISGSSDEVYNRVERQYNSEVMDFIEKMKHDKNGYDKKLSDYTIDPMEFAKYNQKLNDLMSGDDWDKYIELQPVMSEIESYSKMEEAGVLTETEKAYQIQSMREAIELLKK